MKMKWAVEQKYFDSGKVEARMFRVPGYTPDRHERKEKFSLYMDIFESLKETETFYHDILTI